MERRRNGETRVDSKKYNQKLYKCAPINNKFNNNWDETKENKIELITSSPLGAPKMYFKPLVHKQLCHNLVHERERRISRAVRLSSGRQITYNVLRGLPNWISDNTYHGGLMNNAPVGIRQPRVSRPEKCWPFRPRWMGHPLIIKDKRSLSLSFFPLFLFFSLLLLLLTAVRVHGRRRRPPPAGGPRGLHTWPLRMACRERSTDNLQGTIESLSNDTARANAASREDASCAKLDAFMERAYK